MIIAHWFACGWYVIGRHDLKSGNQYGWLSALANNTNTYFVVVVDPATNATELLGGPPTRYYHWELNLFQGHFGEVCNCTKIIKS